VKDTYNLLWPTGYRKKLACRVGRSGPVSRTPVWAEKERIAALILASSLKGESG